MTAATASSFLTLSSATAASITEHTTTSTLKIAMAEIFS